MHGDKTDSAARTPTQGAGGTSASETVSCWRYPEPPRTHHGRVFRRPQDQLPHRGLWIDSKPRTALPKAAKSLSHGSEDKKPLEELESRSPRPPVPFQQVAHHHPQTG